MDDHSKLFRLIDQLYDAVLGDDALHFGFESLAEFAGARRSFYLTVDPQTGASVSANSFSIDPLLQQQCVEH